MTIAEGQHVLNMLFYVAITGPAISLTWAVYLLLNR